MRLLLAEDTEDKRDHLVAFVKSLPFDIDLDEVRSRQSALEYLMARAPDGLILDMSLPTYDISALETGWRHRHFAGRELLQQMDRRGLVIPVIVVTQFDRFGDPPHERTLQSLHADLRLAYPKLYRGCVYYHPTTDAWKEALAELLQTLVAEVSPDR